MKTLTIVPAYGRDYTTPRAARFDWSRGKDFQIMDISSRYDGAYCSLRNRKALVRDGYEALRIRFARREEVVLVPLGDE